jgi:hypothetical protein
MGTKMRHRELITQTVTPWLEIYQFLSTYFRYPYAGGKFERTWEVFFRKVTYTRHDVHNSLKMMDF